MESEMSLLLQLVGFKKLKNKVMNEVSIIINGVRYDAVCVEESTCEICELKHICNFDGCLCGLLDTSGDKVFKHSTKSFIP